MNTEPDVHIDVTTVRGEFHVRAQTKNLEIYGFKLRPDKLELANINNTIKKTLEDIITQGAYSNDLDISEEQNMKNLWKLSHLNLIKKFFPSKDADPEAGDFIEFLQEESKKRSLKIQITTNDLFIPWSLFYDGDISHVEGKVEPEGFWGFKHEIGVLPVLNRRWKYPGFITSNNFEFSLNVNENIDSDFDVDCVRNQYDFFDNFNNSNCKKIVRKDRNELMEDLEKGNITEAIFYFFCHGKTEFDAMDTSFVELSNNTRISLGEFTNCTKYEFKNEPLVFMNTCESAEINPFYYDGFLTYFFSNGSKGLVGTISKIPANFASDFAIQFFNSFFEGKRIGEIFKSLRSHYLKNSNNLLGLFYTHYCQSDLRLKIPIKDKMRR